MLGERKKIGHNPEMCTRTLNSNLRGYLNIMQLINSLLRFDKLWRNLQLFLFILHIWNMNFSTMLYKKINSGNHVQETEKSQFGSLHMYILFCPGPGDSRAALFTLWQTQSHGGKFNIQTNLNDTTSNPFCCILQTCGSGGSKPAWINTKALLSQKEKEKKKKASKAVLTQNFNFAF